MQNKLEHMKTKILFFSLLVSALSLWACGGGGGSGSSGGAGDQSVLRVVNANADATPLDVSVDGQILFTNLPSGQPSLFEAVTVGAHLIQFLEKAGTQRRLEIQNEFDFGVPYTIIAAGSGEVLLPIVAVNDRRDTAPAEFRVRAINASAGSGPITVRLETGQVGREALAQVPVRATIIASPSPTSNVVPTTVVPATPTPPALASPAATPTPQSEITPTATPTVVVTTTPPPASNQTVASNLGFQTVSGYRSVVRGDYRIIVESEGREIARTGVISFAGGQALSLVLISSRAGAFEILRLNDRP